MRQRAGAGHRLRRAAALLAVGAGVRPQLQRHGQHVVAGVQSELGGGGAVHPAAHGHQRAARPGGQRGGAVARRQAERAVQGVGGERGRVHRSGREAAELVGDRLGRDQPRVAQRRAVDQSTAALPAPRAAAQPFASKPASATRSPSTRTEMRIRSPQTAPPAAPGVRSTGERAAAARLGEMVVKGASPHDRQRSRGKAPACRCRRPGWACFCKLGCPPEIAWRQNAWLAPSRTPIPLMLAQRGGAAGVQARA